jgi:galactokinase
VPTPTEGLRLKARARHQVREYQRVESARDALLLGDATLFGELMNASHESCALDYGISCPELDMLVSAARAAGAVGARLTGAGFGGATVNLVPSDEVAAFCRRVDQTYYHGERSPHRHLAVTSVMGAAYTSLTDVA